MNGLDSDFLDQRLLATMRARDYLGAVQFFKFAPGFQEKAFQELVPGATKEQVLGAIGKPLNIAVFPDMTTYWYYSSRGPKYPDYFVRITEFDASGRLVGRCGEFYVAP